MLEVANQFSSGLFCIDGTQSGAMPARRGGLLRSLSMERGFFSRLGMTMKEQEGRSTPDDEPIFRIDPDNPITMMGNSVQLNFTVSHQHSGSSITAHQNCPESDLSIEEGTAAEKVQDTCGQALPTHGDQNAYLQKIASRRKRSNSEDGISGLIATRVSRSAPRRSRSTETPINRASRNLSSSSDHRTGASNMKHRSSTRSPNCVRTIRATETGGHAKATIERRRSDSMSKSDHTTRPRQASRLPSLDKSGHTKRRLETFWPSINQSDHTSREEWHRRRSDSRSGTQSMPTRRHLNRCDSSQDAPPKRSSSVHRRRPHLRRTASAGEHRCIESVVVDDDSKGNTPEEHPEAENPIQFQW